MNLMKTISLILAVSFGALQSVAVVNSSPVRCAETRAPKSPEPCCACCQNHPVKPCPAPEKPCVSPAAPLDVTTGPEWASFAPVPLEVLEAVDVLCPVAAAPLPIPTGSPPSREGPLLHVLNSVLLI